MTEGNRKKPDLTEPDLQLLKEIQKGDGRRGVLIHNRRRRLLENLLAHRLIHMQPMYWDNSWRVYLTADGKKRKTA